MKILSRSKISAILFFLFTTILIPSTFATTYTVTSTADSGPGTLREAIGFANGNAGSDVIDFNIATGPYIITLSGGTLVITDDVFIDGTTQPGYSVRPVIEIKGAGGPGIQILTASPVTGSHIRGLCINSCGAMGIFLMSGMNTVDGCFIGTDTTGTIALGNGAPGISISSSDNKIGGTTPTLRNLISGNLSHGILLTNALNNKIFGNNIGTDVTGNVALPNTAIGISINSSSKFNQIGGLSADSMNVISGNNASGIEINGSNRNGVFGNIIGLGADGITVVANKATGIGIINSDSTLIGSGLAVGGRNLISSNGVPAGLGVNCFNSKHVVLENNFIGVDNSGLLARGNNGNGIIFEASSDGRVGGSATNAGNIIASNQGMGIQFLNSPRGIVFGNNIGIGANGSNPLGNKFMGINISNSDSITIGSSLSGARNIISSNGEIGVQVVNSKGVKLQNNYIGTDATGLVGRGNAFQGVNFSNSREGIVGGSAANEGNIVCSNGRSGLEFNSSPKANVYGNYIGIGANGSIALGNSQRGINIINSDSINIGSASSTQGRNVISSNNEFGVSIENSRGVKLQNNYVGTDATGLIAKGNVQKGVYFLASREGIVGGSVVNEGNIICASGNAGLEFSNSPKGIVQGNRIGIGSDGVTSIANADHGINIQTSDSIQIGGQINQLNIISSNGNHGINIEFSKRVVVVRNIIGLDITTSSAKGNVNNGIYLNRSPYSIIGGPYSGNVISGNGQIGINLDASGYVSIKGNRIGTSASGSVALGNSSHGIQLSDSREVVIGGSQHRDGNVISANSFHGINLNENCNKAVIKGNFIGTDSSGFNNLGNGLVGTVIKSDSCTIGGLANKEGNIISGSKSFAVGVGLLLANASNNSVIGNLIGTSADTTAIPNNKGGINISVEDAGKLAEKNIIRYNVIAYNNGYGITVGKPLDAARIHLGENFNIIRFNSIFCNTEKGIDLNFTSLNNDCGNQCQPAPVINTLQSSASKIVGVPVAGINNTGLIDIYEMTDCPNCELNPQGKNYVATITPNADGTWEYDNGVAISGTMIAVYTNKDSSTSEFSSCFTACGVVAQANISDLIVDLNSISERTLALTSTSTGNALSPLPVENFWILNSADTTLAFSKNATTSVVFARYGGGNVVGPGLDSLYLVVKQGSCFDTIAVSVTTFFIPNLVTPNGDLKNDKWIVSPRSDLFEVKIFNRWGELVYHKDGYTDDWDVTTVSDGIYYYHLDDKTGQGSSYKGWVQVVR